MKLYLLPLLLIGCTNIDDDVTSSKSETIYSTGGKTSTKSTGGSNSTGGNLSTGGTVVINSTGGKSTGGYTSVSVATGGISTGGYTSVATGGVSATGGAAVVYPICPHYNMLGKRYESTRDEFNQLLVRVQNNMACDPTLDTICQISEKIIQRYVCWQPANVWLDSTCHGGEVDGKVCVTDVDILSCGICICVDGVWKKTNNDYDSPSCRH
jgi:hypothetical protein